MKQLIKFENYEHSEVIVDAFSVMETQEVENLFLLAEIYFQLFGTMEHYFAPKNYIKFGTYEDYRNSFSVFNIKESELKVFKKYFNSLWEDYPEFGNGVFMFEISWFYSKFLAYHRQSGLPDEVIKKLKKIEPEFETWMEM